MILPYNETKDLIDLVLSRPQGDARQTLNVALKARGWNEPEFYAGVIQHSYGMDYSSDQWFDFLSKITNGLLRDDSGLLDKLSERQRAELPPPTLT